MQILSSSLKTTCKCHGVSGACTIKTCWKSLPVLRTVAAALQARHVTAVLVRRTGRREPGERRLVPAVAGTGNMAAAEETGLMMWVGAEDLVYCTISPDYCLPDAALGSVGTHNRLVVHMVDEWKLVVRSIYGNFDDNSL